MKSPRLLFLSLLFGILANEPILSIVNTAGMVGGVPVLYAYVTALWLCLIGAIALVVHRSRKASDLNPPDE